MTLGFRRNIVLQIFTVALSFVTVAQCRSLMPPGKALEKWKLPPSSKHSSKEAWMRCHGMPCDVYERTSKKLALLKIGASGGDMDQDPMKINDTELLADDSLDTCIWLNEEQVDNIIKQMKEEKEREKKEMIKKDYDGDDMHPSERHRQKRKVIDFNRFTLNKWPTDKPIAWKFNGAHDPLERDMIRSAFSEWTKHTCLRFTELGVNENYDSNHILVTKEASGCHSYVGRQSWWPQQLNLQAGCIYEIGIPIHEIGHAMGLWHEQQRADRSFVINVNIDNVATWLKGQFQPVNAITTLGVPYDTTSVMHYKHMDGSVNGEPVMETKNPLYQYNMGQRTGLSFADAQIINRAYCSRVCSPSQLPLPCENGGYQDPNDCSSCKCPDGYGGRYCDKAADAVNAFCGGDMMLQPGEEQTIMSPDYDTVGYYSNFQECSWVVKTRSGERLSIEFIDDFRLHCHYQEVCYHWVEVKYGSDKSQAGPRFCCSRKPSSTIMSENDELSVIFKSNYRNTYNPSRRGFKAIIRATGRSTSSPTPPSTTTQRTTTTTPSTTTTTTTSMTTTTPKPITTAPIDCGETDLIFLMDSSGSVMKENWERMTRFIQMVVFGLDIGPSKTRVGLISFGNSATLEIRLDGFDEKYNLLSAISRVEWKDQWTNTPEALDQARLEFLRSQRSAKKVAFLITDGEANVKPETIPDAAAALRDSGVEVFVMGVGPQADYEEAMTIAGSFLNVLPIASFESLLEEMNRYADLVRRRVCEPSDEQMGEDFEWSCDFEGNSGSMCDMSQEDTLDEFDWTLKSGGTPSQETGPSSASQGNFYMFIEASSPRKPGDRALISLPLGERQGTACLTFDYSMYGYHTGALKVVTVLASGRYDSVTWALVGEQGKSWRTASVQITLTKGDQIGLLGVRGAEYSGDIAIDNIKVVGGAC